MYTFKPTIIMDIDGTLHDDFKTSDKRIISELYGNNILIKLLDKFLWSINSLDFISNSMNMLNLRIMIYSILSLKKYKNMKSGYEIKYQSSLLINLIKNEYVLKKLSDNYNIIFVTNNMYAVKVLQKKFSYEIIVANNFLSRRKSIIKKDSEMYIRHVMGNNYTDDILLAKKIKSTSIYVGNSVLKKLYKADYNITTFSDVLKLL